MLDTHSTAAHNVPPTDLVASMLTEALVAVSRPTVDADGSQPTKIERLSRDVGRKIRAAEARLDSAGIAVAEVMIDYLRSEREARLSPSLGQAAVGEIVRALGSWYEFRSHTVSGHEKLYELAGILNTQEIAGGDIFRQA